ncbi:MAG: hypothetical protein ABH879_04585 [archaeon]
MIEKLKKIGIVITIAVLFTIFIFAMTNAVYPMPDYNDFCSRAATIAKPLDREKCGEVLPEAMDCRGPVDYEYDEGGCPVSATCNTCYNEFDRSMESYNMVLFLISSIIGVIAILFGLFYGKHNSFWVLVKGGFLLGGLISLFVGTSIYYQDMARFLKPAVILAELLIVLVVSYRLIKS